MYGERDTGGGQREKEHAMSMVMLLSYPVVGEIAARFVAILVISDHITRLLRLALAWLLVW